MEKQFTDIDFRKDNIYEVLLYGPNESVHYFTDKAEAVGYFNRHKKDPLDCVLFYQGNQILLVKQNMKRR